MTISASRLRELGREYLTTAGQNCIEANLDNNEFGLARSYFLGAFDSLWENGEINEFEARRLYAELGVEEKEATRLRQQHALRS